MDIKRLQEKFSNFSRATARLREAVDANPENSFVYDAAIQRFEFTYELAWKLLKAVMAYNGIAEVNTPREAFKEAFAAGIITDGELWIEMLGDRNLTSHTYDEAMAIKIYNRVKEIYMSLFAELEKQLAREITK